MNWESINLKTQESEAYTIDKKGIYVCHAMSHYTNKQISLKPINTQAALVGTKAYFPNTCRHIFRLVSLFLFMLNTNDKLKFMAIIHH